MNERNRTSSNREPQRGRRAPEGGASVLSQSPMLVLLVLFGLIALLIVGLKGCASGNHTETDPGRATDTAAQTDAPKPSTQEPAPSTEPSTVPTETEVVTEEPTTEPPTTEPPGPVMMTVDDSYFSDALFLGDSRTDGLFLYSTPGNCKHYPYPATSMTIFGIMGSKDENNRYGYSSLRGLLKNEKFGKIYLMFGINECGYNTTKFANTYRDVVEELRSLQPDAIIYIQSICYVTQKKEANASVFATSNIKEKNEAIKVLANDMDIFYLEVNDALNDGTDHLPSDYTGDGVHLKAKYYRLWHDYLLEHAVVDAAHPWEPPVEETTEATAETEAQP